MYYKSVFLLDRIRGVDEDDHRGERKRATTIAVVIVDRAIIIWEAIQKRSHEPIYKTYTKI